MIGTVVAWLATKTGKYVALAVAAALLILLVIGYLRSVEKRGENAGANKVIVETQKETIETQQRRQREREKINEEIRATPFSDRVRELD